MNELFDLKTEDDELEVRFGNVKPITRIEFNNVIHKLKSLGFLTEYIHGTYLLRIIHPENNTRGEIEYLQNIKKYCRTNSLDGVKFIQKKRVAKPYDVKDYNFRVNLKSEKEGGIINESDGKIFRFLKRFTFTHPDLSLKVDCSIVKMSRKRKNRYVPYINVIDSGVFDGSETYEIEIEIGKLEKKEGMNQLKKVIKYVLAGIQQTNYPISYKEMKKIGLEYLSLIHGKNENREILPKDFIGPSSISLEMPNIMKEGVLHTNYSVTDKADGYRKLLFISKSGKVYLIDTNMNFQFTGCISKKFKNTIIDGEHILHDKHGKYINKFLAFDLYYKEGEYWGVYPLLYIEDLKYDMNIDKNRFRLDELLKIIRDMEFESVIGKKAELIVEGKKFYYKDSIYKNTKKVYDSTEILEYNWDGFIFTPIDKSIGSNKLGEKIPSRKLTWFESFKWKPSEFNTIDFLVTTKKNKEGGDFIGNIFQDGEDLQGRTTISKYKILTLRVGYDETKHGYINPCELIIQDQLPRRSRKEFRYRPRAFMPPGDNEAYICHVLIHQNAIGNYYMMTENGEEVFDDETIVEFRYDKTRDKYWRWVPIKVRYDKTSEYRKGFKNYGNAYHVAYSVWKSIHNPVTLNMITTGKDIMDYEDNDIYYRGSGDSKTKALRNFHNRVVKLKLIKSVCKPGDNLIDLAVGKGGDIPKWKEAKLGFVFGLDIARDNIENRLDGVCARYLNAKQKNRNIFRGLFVEADSSKDIRSGEACATEKGKLITKAIFGDGPKDETKLGTGVYKVYGIGKGGFDIVSTQFAIHYFFKTEGILRTYLKNVSNCCKVGGYFIGTSYDGLELFKQLQPIEKGKSISSMKDSKKIWEIKKQYDQDNFEDNNTSIGLAIDVYQESINCYWREYLVNYNYLTQIIQEYGFRLATQDEINNIPSALGNFNDLYDNDILSASEKRISFLNKYFIYKKMGKMLSDQSSKKIKKVPKNK